MATEAENLILVFHLGYRQKTFSVPLRRCLSVVSQNDAYPPKCIVNSATKLGYFKPNFHTKEAQLFGLFLGDFVKNHLFK